MIKKIYYIFLFFLLVNPIYADQIKITSDKLEVIRTENISIFSGNVYAINNNLEIWSDKIIMTSTENEKSIKEINAHDNVKILREELSISGNKAKYNPIMNELFVFGKVKVIQNQNTILCDEIFIDLENSSSILKSDSTRRVEAIIISNKLKK